MCEDAQREVMNCEEFNSQDLDEKQHFDDDWDESGDHALPIVYDDLTGLELVPEKVREARLDEMRALE